MGNMSETVLEAGLTRPGGAGRTNHGAWSGSSFDCWSGTAWKQSPQICTKTSDREEETAGRVARTPRGGGGRGNRDASRGMDAAGGRLVAVGVVVGGAGGGAVAGGAIRAVIAVPLVVRRQEGVAPLRSAWGHHQRQRRQQQWTHSHNHTSHF